MDNDKYYNAFGGLLFGYDTTKMRFWVPSEWPVANGGNNGYLKMYIRVSMDAYKLYLDNNRYLTMHIRVIMDMVRCISG